MTLQNKSLLFFAAEFDVSVLHFLTVQQLTRRDVSVCVVDGSTGDIRKPNASFQFVALQDFLEISPAVEHLGDAESRHLGFSNTKKSQEDYNNSILRKNPTQPEEDR